MVILATLPNHSLFSSLPPTPTRHPSGNSSTTLHPSPGPPIPIPKYPPKPKPKPKPKPHNLTKFHKPIPPSGEKIPAADDRAVVIGENGVSYLLPDAPFEFQFSYSETPKAKPVAIRQPVFLPFAPPSMGRPWTGKAPLKKKKEKKKIPVFDSFNPPPPGKKGMKVVEMPGPYKMGQFPKEGKSREEILGEPLSKAEIKMLIQPLLSDNRQINLGRDGLTHNMLELIHTHWKRRRVCKVKCKGVPTVDMNNVCKHLEEKTGGKIIHRAGGVVYLFRGRNYNYRTRPQYPLMLWKPAAPVYPKLIQDAPEGLTKEEADELRKKGKSLSPICKLAKNGVYDTLVRDVRYAFEASPLVKVDCRGLDPSDYKKIGAKLMELVPCVLLSFDVQQILMWRGRDWKSMYPDPPPNTTHSGNSDANVSYPDSSDGNPREHGIATVRSSPRMMSLWKHAIELHKALLLDKTTGLSPDALLQKVEEFEAMTQENEHSDPALLISGKESEVRYENSSEDNTIGGEEEEDYDDDYDEYTDSDPFDDADLPVSFGSLPVDHLAKRLQDDRYFR